MATIEYEGWTRFANSPAIIRISGLKWDPNSALNKVCLDVYIGEVKHPFRAELSSDESSTCFDISSALRSAYADYDFSGEITAATNAKRNLVGNRYFSRPAKEFSLNVWTEYYTADTYGNMIYTVGTPATPSGKKNYFMLGRATELERSKLQDDAQAISSIIPPTGGDSYTSTKPIDSPERIGPDSIVSSCYFSGIYDDSSDDSSPNNNGSNPTYLYQSYSREDTDAENGRIVFREPNLKTFDFLFVNRHGAVETCCAIPSEAAKVKVSPVSYERGSQPQWVAKPSLFGRPGTTRKSWSLSSGNVDSEWAEWWATEFLASGRWWMWYNGAYEPVLVTPASDTITIYDRAKQELPSVEFTVTLALEG